MKTTSVVLTLGLSAIATASPTQRVKRAADVNEAASVGFATQNGGTTGGAGATTTTVTTLAELKSCAGQTQAAICVVQGTITGAEAISVTSDTTILGKDYTAVLKGVGLKINGKKGGAKVSNVIVRNLSIDKVLASTGDAIGMQYAENVWIDHVDLQGDRAQSDKDLYDGLLDITHGSDWISVTNSYLHNHWKGSLVGHSDSNEAEDTGHLTVTYANNFFHDLNSRAPSFRFGTGHIFNNYFLDISDGINTRLGAKLLVEGNVFEGVSKPLYAVDDDGLAASVDNDFGGVSTDDLPATTTVTIPYKYTALPVASTWASVWGPAGATLVF